MQCFWKMHFCYIDQVYSLLLFCLNEENMETSFSSREISNTGKSHCSSAGSAAGSCMLRAWRSWAIGCVLQLYLWSYTTPEPTSQNWKYSFRNCQLPLWVRSSWARKLLHSNSSRWIYSNQNLNTAVKFKRTKGTSRFQLSVKLSKPGRLVCEQLVHLKIIGTPLEGGIQPLY